MPLCLPFTALETKNILLPLGTISETETRHCGTVDYPHLPALYLFITIPCLLKTLS